MAYGSVHLDQDVAPNVLKDSLSRLDELSNPVLYKSVRRAVDALGSFTEDIAARLDSLFAVKLVRVLRSPHSIDLDLRSLDELVARIGSERFRETLESLPARYFSRWRAMRDVIGVAQSINNLEHERQPIDHTPDETSTWEFVASKILRQGDQGISWSAMARDVMEYPRGPKTKGGVSQLITAMRAAGWIDATQHGRTKQLYPGRRISESKASKAMQAPASMLAEALDSGTPLELQLEQLQKRLEDIQADSRFTLEIVNSLRHRKADPNARETSEANISAVIAWRASSSAARKRAGNSR